MRHIVKMLNSFINLSKPLRFARLKWLVLDGRIPASPNLSGVIDEPRSSTETVEWPSTCMRRSKRRQGLPHVFSGGKPIEQGNWARHPGDRIRGLEHDQEQYLRQGRRLGRTGDPGDGFVNEAPQRLHKIPSQKPCPVGGEMEALEEAFVGQHDRRQGIGSCRFDASLDAFILSLRSLERLAGQPAQYGRFGSNEIRRVGDGHACRDRHVSVVFLAGA